MREGSESERRCGEEVPPTVQREGEGTRAKGCRHHRKLEKMREMGPPEGASPAPPLLSTHGDKDLREPKPE